MKKKFDLNYPKNKIVKNKNVIDSKIKRII